MVQKFTDTEAYADECIFFWTTNKANIFLGLIEYELNGLHGASHLVDYISVHIQFDLERYLLNSPGQGTQLWKHENLKQNRNNGKENWGSDEQEVMKFETYTYLARHLQ